MATMFLFCVNVEKHYKILMNTTLSKRIAQMFSIMITDQNEDKIGDTQQLISVLYNLLPSLPHHFLILH